MKVEKCVKESFVVIGKESKAIKYLEDNAIPLVGAVHDFTCPQTGKNYMFFPIRRL